MVVAVIVSIYFARTAAPKSVYWIKSGAKPWKGQVSMACGRSLSIQQSAHVFQLLDSLRWEFHPDFHVLQLVTAAPTAGIVLDWN